MKIMLIGTIVDNNNIVGLRVTDLDEFKPENFCKADETGKIRASERINHKDITLGQAYKLLVSGYNISGLEIAGNSVKGSNGSLDRYPKFDSRTLMPDSTTLVILNRVGDSKLSAILTDGTIKVFDNSVIIKGVLSKKTAIANGTVKQKQAGVQAKSADDFFVSSLKGEYEQITEADFMRQSGVQRFRVDDVTKPKEDKQNKIESTPSTVTAEAVKVSKEELLENEMIRNTLYGCGNSELLYVSKVPDELLHTRDKHGFTLPEKISRAFDEIKKIRPFYYFILASLNVTYTLGDNSLTFAVEPGTLYINPLTTINLPMPHVIFALLHETNHIAMCHFDRFGKGVNHELMNIATDLYINETIIADFKLSRDGLCQRLSNTEEKYNLKELDEMQLRVAKELDEAFDNKHTTSIDFNKLSVKRDFIALPLWVLTCNMVDLKNDTAEIIYNELLEDYMKKKEQKQQQQGNQEGSDENNGGQQNSQQGQGQSSNEQQSSGNQGQNSQNQSSDNQEQSQSSSGQGQNSGGQGQSSGGQGSDSKLNDLTFRGKKVCSNDLIDDAKKKAEQYKEGEVLDEDQAVTNFNANASNSKDIVTSEENKNKTPQEKAATNESTLHTAIERARMDKTLDWNLIQSDNTYIQVLYTLAPKVNWKNVLKRYLVRRSEKVLSYSKPDTNYYAMGKRLPGPTQLDPSELGDVLIAVDTSGSITSKELGIAFAQIEDMLKKYKTEGVLQYWGSEIVATYKFKDIKELLKNKPVDGGGTDPNCIFKQFDAREYKIGRKKKPDVILVFTDGCFGNLETRFKTKFKNCIWIISDESQYKNFEPPFGVKAVLKQD